MTTEFIPSSEHTARATLTNRKNREVTYRCELYLAYLIGDANANGVVDMADVTAIERLILGLDPLIFLPPFDVNKDGVVNMADVTTLEYYILGIIPFPPPVKVASSGMIDITIPPLSNMTVDFPIVMPDQLWTYQVFLEITMPPPYVSTCPRCDVNNDGWVNVLDMVLVGQHIDETGPNGWIPEDINEDGIVDERDLALVEEHWTDQRMSVATFWAAAPVAVTPPAPNIVLNNLVINPLEAWRGNTVAISVIATNIGTLTGT